MSDEDHATEGEERHGKEDVERGGDFLRLGALAGAGAPAGRAARRRSGGPPPRRTRPLRGRGPGRGGGHHRPDAGGDDPGRAHLPRPRRLVPRADRGLDQSGPTVNSVLEVNPDARRIARALDGERKAGPRARPAARHPHHAQGQHRHRRPMQTTAGSLALVGRAGPAGRHRGRAAARGGRGHPRQDQPLASGPTSAASAPPAAGAAGAARPATPTCSTATPAARAPGSARAGRGQPRRRRPRHRDRRLDRLPGQRQRRRRHQADGGPDQPRRRHPHLPHPGHGRPARPHGGRRGGGARRAGRASTPATRPTAASAGKFSHRLHAVPRPRRPARARASASLAAALHRLQPRDRRALRGGARGHARRRRDRWSIRPTIPTIDALNADQAEIIVLIYEFKRDLNAYLATRTGVPVHIARRRHRLQQRPRRAGDAVLRPGVLRARAGRRSSPQQDYQDALERGHRLAGTEGIDAVLADEQPGRPGRAHRLARPGRPTSSTATTSRAPAPAPSAVAGYPIVNVPAGYVLRPAGGAQLHRHGLQRGQAHQAGLRLRAARATAQAADLPPHLAAADPRPPQVARLRERARPALQHPQGAARPAPPAVHARALSPECGRQGLRPSAIPGRHGRDRHQAAASVSRSCTSGTFTGVRARRSGSPGTLEGPSGSARGHGLRPGQDAHGAVAPLPLRQVEGAVGQAQHLSKCDRSGLAGPPGVRRPSPPSR